MLTFQDLNLSQIKSTLSDDGLYHLSNLDLTKNELIQLGKEISSIGEVLSWDFGQVMEMKYNEDSVNYLFSSERVPLHWDGAFHRVPQFLIFYCVESSINSGGETLFTNTQKIYDSLTSEEKEECSQVSFEYTTEKMAHYGGVIIEPLLQMHPQKLTPILRIAEEVQTDKNPVRRVQVAGNHKICSEIEKRLNEESFCHSHKWAKGDLVIVDNFTFLHGRNPLGENLSRSFNRVQAL